MCSSQGICSSNERSHNRSTHSGSNGSGAHYALCALGVGLIALGVVMIVWTVIPVDGEAPNGSTNSSSNATADVNDGHKEKGKISKSSSVAMVLVGVGLAMLLLFIFLGIRSKRRARESSEPSAAAATAFLDHVAGDQAESAPDPASFNVPTYEEVVGSSDYPVRQSNLRQSTTNLPSYEDIIAAVENEGTEPAIQPAEDTSVNEPTSPGARAAADASARQPSLPAAHSTSRASRLLRPLRVRRIKSDKLHLKDFRIQIRSPTQNPVTIEPITPPPQYENKAPELG